MKFVAVSVCVSFLILTGSAAQSAVLHSGPVTAGSGQHVNCGVTNLSKKTQHFMVEIVDSSLSVVVSDPCGNGIVAQGTCVAFFLVPLNGGPFFTCRITTEFGKGTVRTTFHNADSGVSADVQ